MRTWAICLLFAACTSGAVEDDLLPRDRFREVLLEAQLIEARMNRELVAQPEGEVPTAKYYEELFTKEGVTKEQFQRTFDHYADRPEELKAIYEEIITELSQRKDAPVQPSDTLPK
jgi:hypothetical protein